MTATPDEILGTISGLIRDQFDDYHGPISRALRAPDVPQWDSLGHVQFVVLIEQSFGIRFNSSEIHSFDNLGQLVDAVSRKLA